MTVKHAYTARTWPCTRAVNTAVYTCTQPCTRHVHVYRAVDKAVDTAATAVHTGRKDSRVHGRNRSRVHGSCAWVNGPCTCERAVLGVF